ncbi:Hypothetical protein NocV09_00302930 [Nannochloropsis oceanica]
MGKKRKSQPVVEVVKSRKRARKIVTQFHKVNDAIAVLEKNASLAPAEKEATRKELEGNLEALGGRAAYQSASQLSVSFHNTSKWVLARLQAMGVLAPKPSSTSSSSSSSSVPPVRQRKLRLLEVGAITTTLLDCPALETTAIDLLSRHARIRQQDFFTLPLPPSLTFHVIVSSMVINSLPTPVSRGLFLRRCHSYLQPHTGHLFLMLPSSCLTHSKNITTAKFRLMLTENIGFRIMEERWTPKVAYFVLRAEDGKVERIRGSEGEGKGGGKAGGRRERKASSSWAKNFDVVL